ncbi:TPA: SspB-related isopeptide-forming adhesin [Streptococcus pyogenes]|uniref:SspB-related isopeptide-forming adhesin n=3 Tax=Streptococcus TaxID=1301 RepID=UPI00101ABFEA|nr:SspB-related isopeptide-forming adhesin [Streptococcus pyogenes]QBB42111.1 LPXTG cell wall anchor domain-containing protein [Streptococcus pyogenes]HEP2678421.1 LPXTG cell wall anchor domain-containing protein [Streptococcus pyogenes]HER2350405.1 LPXTG cell wall anchor domain-containing protein [Streptococcus pyogenes]HER6589704.1 LPXTG cell wall anchor domain-containing protein [Streptococcus pyogenes]HER8431147.1 LPXTG cell wall anchor domain-containing protein [Streptococcus pyogenes]
MKQMETKGYGYFRKTKAYGLVCGITLAGALTLGTTSVSADDVTTLNPATNLTTLQTPPTADQTQLAHQAGQQSGELVSEVSNTEWDNAVTTAQKAGVTVKQSEKVTHDSLSSAQADLEKQTQAVTEATTKQEANTTAINQAVSENKAIDQANRDEKARVDALNTKGEADTKAKNETGQAQVDAQNKQAQAAADAMNAKLKADYEAKLTEIKQIESENEAIRQRNQQASQATHQANQAAQAAYQEKLAEIERIKAENAAIRDRNAKAQQEAERQNQALQAAYEAKLAEIKQIESENAAIRQRNEQAGQATNQTNQAAQAAYQEKLAEIERIKAGNAAIRDRNAKAQQEAERQNQALQAAYEAKLAEIKQIESENAAIRKRNEQAGQTTNQTNQAAQAAYQEKLAEIERINAENAAIRDRNTKARQEAERQNQQLKTTYEAQLSAYQQALQAKKEAENKAIDQVVFGIDAKANGVDNAEYGNSIMTVTTQPDGSFVFKHDMIDGVKTIGHGTLTGKINHHYEANKDGSITAYIDSVTFDKYEYQNVAKNDAVDKNIAFRILSATGQELFVKAHDGDKTFSETLNKTVSLKLTYQLKPHEAVKDIKVFQLHDDWVHDTHGSALVSYVNNNDAVPHIEVPEKPVEPDMVTPKVEQEKPVPEAPQKPTDGVPNLEKEKPVPPTPVKPEAVKPVLEQEKPVPEAPQKPTDDVPNLEKEKPVPPTPVKPEAVKPVLEQEKPVPEAPQKPTDDVPNLEKEKPVPPTPVEPEAIKPDLQSFTPEVYDPIKPVVKPHVTVPEKVVYEVMVHPVQVKQTPTNVKSVTNSDQVNIDGQLVPKGSTVTWELVNTSLKAGRQDITSYELTDPLPDGFELDVTATQTLSPEWVITTDEAGKVSLKASQSLLAHFNAKRDQDVEVPKVSLVGRLLNDAGTYHNTFKTVVTTPTGSYTVISNTPVIYTPGNDPKTPRNPGGDNPTPHDNLIQPTKTTVDDKGQSIDGKSVLPNSTLTYVAKQDFDQYKGMTAAKESVMKGFIYVDDYKDEAIDGHSLVVNSIKAANGDDVTNLLEMRHVLSQDTLDDKLKALIKASGISPVGEFYMWVAKDPAAFYKAYVQKGLDITYNLSFKLKQDFKKGDITNQTYQIDFGNGYYGNIVVNHLSELTVHKDVFDKEGGQSINAGTVKVGDEVTYRLEGWVVPTNRGYDLTEYKFVDQLQHTHDLYQKDKVLATVDITLSDGSVITKGTDLAKYTETVYNKETGHYELAFKQDFLAKVVRSSEFGADAFVVVKRIKAGDVANEYTLYVNGNPVKSNKVTTHTPEQPQPVTPKAPALPSTGEQGVSILTALGAALLSLLGYVGLKKRQQ